MGSEENELTQAAIQYFGLRGCYVWRNNTGAVKQGDRYVRYGFPGSADILGITMDGRMIACEVKSQFGRLSSYQQEFLREIRLRGGVGIVIQRGDWQVVIDTALQAITAHRPTEDENHV